MLNFDPARWLAEHAPAESAFLPDTAATLATVATLCAKSRESGRSVATVASVAGISGENEKPEPAPEPARWRSKLAALNPAQPLCGIPPTRWQTLLADARWLADVHGDRAAAEGWNASDLFGIDLGPGRSGLADRLDGARTVYIFAEHATWQRDGWRWGMVPLHRDLPPLWKLAGPTRNRR